VTHHSVPDTSYAQPQNNVLLLGASAVGKSCIFQRTTDKEWKFLEEINATIAVTKPQMKPVQMADGKEFKIKLWDCGGQERFKNISKAFLKDARGCIIIFSVDSTKSLESAKMWIESINHMRKEDGKEIQIILAANKVDLPPNMVEFKDWREEGKKLAEKSSSPQYGDVPFFETSAKTGLNVEKVFVKMAEMIIKANAPGPDAPSTPPATKEGGGCCILM